VTTISDTDLRQIVTLYKMTEDAAQSTDDHIKNEAANAVPVLFRLLSKHGLSLSDLPELRRRYEAKVAAKATAAPAAAQSADPNVLDLTQDMLRAYIAVQPHEYVGITLWILHTHVFAKFQITPRLALLSPVRGCGKSKLLLLLEKLTANPERHDNISAASLFRIIENHAGPTLLLDEGDNLGLRIDKTMRSVLNSGHLMGGSITRTIRGQPQSFSTFAPAAIGAIGTLPLPLLHRSIVIQMQRGGDDLKTIQEMKTDDEVRRFGVLHQHIAAWAANVTQFDPSPPLPKILRGRTADNWRVLIAIADQLR
jgi:Protein of unknown function (DUF3631)